MATNGTMKAAVKSAGTLAELLKQLGEEKQKTKALQKKLFSTRAALRKYGTHEIDCAVKSPVVGSVAKWIDSDNGKCTCGLGAIVKETR